MRFARAVAATCFAVTLIACESVPDLTFASHDASTGEASTDAADDTAAATDAQASDGDGEAATCTPSGAYTSCCGAMPCSGNCGTSNCATCIGTCGTNQFCCVKPNNRVTCNAVDSTPCP